MRIGPVVIHYILRLELLHGTFKNAPKVHQKRHQKCTKMHQKCTKSAPKMHQKMHQKCTTNVQKMYKK